MSFVRPCGPSRAAWLLFLFLASLLLPQSVHADDGYADLLVNEAVSLKLHERRAWQVLLHYKPNLYGRHRSLVDDPRFFNSPEGKYDAKDELRATIRAFFRTDVEGDAHPQCLFIARYAWLKDELSIDASRLPSVECKGFRELHEHVRPMKAVLIFPVSHMNSPASMFGHTLLRIDSDKESNMYSFAVNYSAITDETNGVFFAIKGLLGFYEGYFGLLPYYEKIKEYSNLENRDIWEYPLDFTKDEVERMLLHLWELKDVYTHYYFFDENCSYNLLLVLEAARPGVNLSEMMPPWVIPMDTVRAIRETGYNSGAVVYRPAKAAKIRHIEGVLGDGLRKLADDAAYGARDPDEIGRDAEIPKDDRARVLDLASEYLQYRYAKRMVAKDEYSTRYLKVLGARSRLGQIPEYRIEAPRPPEEGHGPARLSLGTGVKEGAAFLSLRARPANHALLDPDAGYLPGAAITFMEAEARYNFTEEKLSLERFTLVDITSASPRDEFFKPISWKVSAEIQREESAKREHRTVFRVFGGPGLSYGGAHNSLFYGFIEPEAKAGSGLDDGYAIGAGVRAGAITNLKDWWKAQLELRATAFGPGESHSIISAELNQTFSIERDMSLMLNIKREKFDGFHSTEVIGYWNLYF